MGRRVGMLEAPFTRNVLGACRLHGWRAAHFRAAVTTKGRHLTPVAGQAKGFPDVMAVSGRHGFTMYAELKTSAGRPTPEQVEWLDLLALRHANDASTLVTIIRPAEWTALLDFLHAPHDQHRLTPWRTP